MHMNDSQYRTDLTSIRRQYAQIWLYLCMVVLVGLGCTQEQGDVTPSNNLSIQVRGTEILDANGKPLILRSINVGGGAKLPSVPDLRSDDDSFLATTDVSFVGRPLPLDEALTHFARIRSWGFNCIRLVMTWEAIAHGGPYAIDTDYLIYLDNLVKLAGEAGLRVVLDMHQDVWSRWSGGDGAPRWTFAVAGLDVTRFTDHGAAVLHSQADTYPHLVWATNHTKLAAATMFTLFWAGEVYAPEATTITQDGQIVTIQRFLQDAYTRAWVAVAQALGHHDNVVGYDLMNEPGLGYIGLETLDKWNTQLTLGIVPSPAQSMFAALTTQVLPEYAFEGLGFSEVDTVEVNPMAQSIWLPGVQDIWQQAGVWQLNAGQPTVVKDGYFAVTDPVATYLAPYYQSLAQAIAAVDDNAIAFVEPPAENHAAIPWPTTVGVPAVYAAHWYDAYAIIQRTFDPEYSVDATEEIAIVIGREDVQALFNRQIGHLVELGHRENMPVYIGEFGLPFDPEESGFESRITALQMYYEAMAVNKVSSSLWHYNPYNTASDGDGWNIEDFSVISQEDPEGRAVEGFRLEPQQESAAAE